MFDGMTLVCLNGMGLCMFHLTIDDGFHLISLLGPSVLFGMKYFNHQISERAEIPSMRKTCIESTEFSFCRTV